MRSIIPVTYRLKGVVMHSVLIKCIVSVACAALLTGCAKNKEPHSSKIVDDFTGKSTIKTGEKLKKKVKELEKLQEERFKEAEEVK
jgi:type IV pilus biogenesis protein CpaD/CtpE